LDNFQYSLFYSLQTFVESSPLYRKYFYLFQAIDLSELPDRNLGIGCTGFSRRAMLRALIVKSLEGIPSIPRLVEYLQNHPVIAEMCGFNMMKKLPDESQFYRFLKHINNSELENIHHKINKTLIEQGSFRWIPSSWIRSPSWRPAKTIISKILTETLQIKKNA